MHEYYTSHMTIKYHVGIGTLWAVKSVREESWCHVCITSVDEDDVDGNINTDDVSSVQSYQKKFAILHTTSDGSYAVNLLDTGMSVAQKMVDDQMAANTKKWDTVTLDHSVYDKESDVVRYSDTPLKPGETLEFVTVMPLVLPHNIRVRMIKYLQFRFTKSSVTVSRFLVLAALTDVHGIDLTRFAIKAKGPDVNWKRKHLAYRESNNVLTLF